MTRALYTLPVVSSETYLVAHRKQQSAKILLANDYVCVNKNVRVFVLLNLCTSAALSASGVSVNFL